MTAQLPQAQNEYQHERVTDARSSLSAVPVKARSKTTYFLINVLFLMKRLI